MRSIVHVRIDRSIVNCAIGVPLCLLLLFHIIACFNFKVEDTFCQQDNYCTTSFVASSDSEFANSSSNELPANKSIASDNRLLFGVEPLKKATTAESVSNSNDTKPFSRFGCHCDTFCVSYGDCCPDRSLFQHLYPDSTSTNSSTTTEASSNSTSTTAASSSNTTTTSSQPNLTAASESNVSSASIESNVESNKIDRLNQIQFTCSSFTQPTGIQLNIFTVNQCAKYWATNSKSREFAKDAKQIPITESVRRYQLSIRHKCEQRVSPTADTFLSVPIFSLVTGLTYKNIFCAVCNEDVSSALPWSVESFCDHSSAPETPPVEDDSELENGSGNSSSTTSSNSSNLGNATATANEITYDKRFGSPIVQSGNTITPAPASTINISSNNATCTDTRMHFKPPPMFNYRPCVPAAIHDCPASTAPENLQRCQLFNEIMYGPQIGLIKNRYCAECNQLGIQDYRCEAHESSPNSPNGFPIPFYLINKKPEPPVNEKISGFNNTVNTNTTIQEQSGSDNKTKSLGDKESAPSINGKSSGAWSPPTTTFPQQGQLPQQVPAYSLILDIDFSKGGSVVGTKSRCPPNYLYDPWKKICRLITCDQGSMMINNHCVSRAPRDVPPSVVPVSDETVSSAMPLISPGQTLPSSLPGDSSVKVHSAVPIKDNSTDSNVSMMSSPTEVHALPPSAQSLLTKDKPNLGMMLPESNSVDKSQPIATFPPQALGFDSKQMQSDRSTKPEDTNVPLVSALNSTIATFNETPVAKPQPLLPNNIAFPSSQNPLLMQTQQTQQVVPSPAVNDFNQSMIAKAHLSPLNTETIRSSVKLNPNTMESVAGVIANTSAPFPPSASLITPVYGQPNMFVSSAHAHYEPNSLKSDKKPEPEHPPLTLTPVAPAPMATFASAPSINNPSEQADSDGNSRPKITISCARLTFMSNEYVRYANGSVRIPPNPHFYTAEEYQLDQSTGRLSICAPDLETQHLSRKFTLVQQYLTVFGLSISIFSLLINILACALKWRQQNIADVLILWMSAALLVAQLLFLFGINQVFNVTLCRCVGITMHFSFLCSFFITNLLMFDIFRAFSHLSQFGWRKSPGAAVRWKAKLIRYALYGFALPALIVGFGVALDCVALRIDQQGKAQEQIQMQQQLFFQPVINEVSMDPVINRNGSNLFGSNSKDNSINSMLNQSTQSQQLQTDVLQQQELEKQSNKTTEAESVLLKHLDSNDQSKSSVTTSNVTITTSNSMKASIDSSKLPETVEPLTIPSELPITLNIWKQITLWLAPQYGYAVCWISNRKSLLALFAVPLGLILMINIMFYMLTAHQINRLSKASKVISKLNNFSGMKSSAFALKGTSKQKSLKRAHSLSPRFYKRRYAATDLPELLPNMRFTFNHSVRKEFNVRSSIKQLRSFKMTARRDIPAHLAISLKPYGCKTQPSIRQMYQQSQRSYNRRKQEHQSFFSLYIRLALIIGLTWIFGFVAAFANSWFLWCIFITCNSLQGFFILFAFNGNWIRQKVLIIGHLLKQLLCRSRYWMHGDNPTSSYAESSSALPDVICESVQLSNQFKSNLHAPTINVDDHKGNGDIGIKEPSAAINNESIIIPIGLYQIQNDVQNSNIFGKCFPNRKATRLMANTLNSSSSLTNFYESIRLPMSPPPPSPIDSCQFMFHSSGYRASINALYHNPPRPVYRCLSDSGLIISERKLKIS